MNIFKNLFGKKEGGPKESSGKSYREKDDMGTRHDTLSKASSYWMARMSQVKKEPYVLYIFDKETDAIEGVYLQAFAAGAMLTMLADTMMPEAFEHGGKVVGLFTVLGFFLAAVLSVLE